MAKLTIFLPKNSEPMVLEGDTVTFGQILTEDISSNSITYSISHLLNIPPKHVEKALLKKMSDSVIVGDILAIKRTLFASRVIKATISGKITNVDLEKGNVEVTPMQAQEDLVICPVDGRVTHIGGDELEITFQGTLIHAKQGMGRMRKGFLTVVGKSDGEAGLAELSEDQKNKVLLALYMPRQLLEKAFGIGVASVIIVKVDEEDFSYFEAHGSLDPALAIVNESDYETLKLYEEKEVVVEGMHKRIIIQT